jgi:hypothetical protein
LAERERFELSVPFEYAVLAGLWFKPLTHLSRWLSRLLYTLAEGEGFEPPVGCPTTVFKTAAFNHSANPPVRADA